MFSLVRKRIFRVLCVRNSSLLLSVQNKIVVFPECVAYTNIGDKCAYSLKHRLKPSRFHPRPINEVIQGEIQSLLSEKVSMNNEEWDNFKIEMMTERSFITEENFCSIVMSCILNINKLNLAHSFIKYIEQNNVKPNFLTYLKYISLCSKNRRLVDQELILSTFEKIQNLIVNSPALDRKSIEYIIQGLCATHKWRDSFDYLKKLVEKPSMEISSVLACAALRNNDENLTWEILKNWVKEGEIPGDRVVEEFLLVALELQKKKPVEGDLLIQKLFQYMHNKSMIINYNTTKLIEQYFTCHRMKWITSYTKVNRGGYCENCGHCLAPSQLTDQEFNYLKNSFLERALKKSDVFINSTEKEINRYMDFIEKNKPFHVVVDGLNTAYTYPYNKAKKNLASHLLKVVKILGGRSKKLLVLGRRHMKTWPSFAMQKIEEKTKLFYTDNISEDDPFVIYSALASGPHTLFLSGDLMRDHMARLDDPNTIHLFKKWQQSHQMFVIGENDFTIKFVEPVRHSIAVQGTMTNGWHIPFDDKIILDPYEELNNWLCIRAAL